MTESVDSLGFMVKLCCFSGESRYPGYIQSEYQRGIPHPQLASMLGMPLELFETLYELNIKAGRINSNGNDVIHIVNWNKYQSIPEWDGNPDTEPPDASYSVNDDANNKGKSQTFDEYIEKEITPLFPDLDIAKELSDFRLKNEKEPKKLENKLDFRRWCERSQEYSKSHKKREKKSKFGDGW